jgi:hypothetical protein
MGNFDVNEQSVSIQILGETGCEVANEIHLAAYRFQWWDFVNTEINLRVRNPTATFLAANIFKISVNILHNKFI